MGASIGTGGGVVGVPVAVGGSSAATQGIALRQPAWRITIRGRDVTHDLTPMLLSVAYADHRHGQADEIEVQLEDTDGRWRTTWWPDKGDRVACWIGYDGAPLLPCGDFEIDDVESSGQPDVCRFRALAAGITPALRTKRSRAFENQTLRQIATKVAAANGLTVLGEIEDVRLTRVTQHDEDDLAFLTRLAEAHDHVFSVRGEQLVFYNIAALVLRAPQRTLTPGDVGRYRFRAATALTYKSCDVAYFDPRTKALHHATIDDPDVVKGDTLAIKPRVESEAEATARARAALARANRRQVTGHLELEGDPTCVAGVTIAASGWGQYDRNFQVEASRHAVDRVAGYTTSIELAEVGGVLVRAKTRDVSGRFTS